MSGLFDPPAPKNTGSRPKVVEGVLDHVTFTNEENGWSVVKIKIEGRAGLITAVGSLPGVQPGESLRLDGEWVVDRKYGEQFRIKSFLLRQPSTLEGMEKYLGSGLIRGMGQVMAARLVEHFQFDTLDVIDHQPRRLTEVEGIGPKRQAQIVEAWGEQKVVKEVMLFLQTHAVSPAYAVKIYKQYGDRAVIRVRENPFQLSVDIHGIGFKMADQIAASLGISKDSPRRAEAGVLYTLGELADEGHVLCPEELLLDKSVAILSIDAHIIEQAITDLAVKEHLVIEPLPQGRALFLKALHQAETGAARLIRRLLDTPTSPFTSDLDRAIAKFEEHEALALAPQQREALRQAATAKVTVITGGPGTGKTTIINGLVQILEQEQRRVRLCAPTGRAAKRLGETSQREAKTIHRLLEFNPRRRVFERDEEAPLKCDLLVVDEMSMVDTSLFYYLLLALPPDSQLVLVGDVDQLPSVGPGSVLRDLIRSGTVNVVTLTEIFRQAQESLIVRNAHRVNQGELPSLQRGDPGGKDSDFFLIERDDPETILATLKELVSRRIPDYLKVDPLEEIQVLTPMHKGILGSINLNEQLQQLLNPRGESLARGSRIFRVGDKVMQVRNNYDLDVFNGDIGRIASINADDQQATIQFDGRAVPFDFSAMDDLVLGYACSIHKAQGSEYPVVLIPLHTQHYIMLQRNLLYTGITRGRRLVVLVGSRKALGLAVKNNRIEMRHTRLAERLSGRVSS